METKYKVGDNLWHKRYKCQIEIIEYMGNLYEEDTYRFVYWKSDRGNPLCNWGFCVDEDVLLEKPTMQEYWISHVEKTNLVYGYKIEANSLSEAIEKAKNNDYIESKFLGVEEDSASERVEEDWCVQELDFEDTENYIEPEYKFYRL